MIKIKVFWVTGFTHIVEILPNQYKKYVEFLESLNGVERFEVVSTPTKSKVTT